MNVQKPSERILNPEQKQAVEWGEGPLLIIAGAGTGKTTVVTERIKYLIASEKAKPDEILALTFTEKASREMEERVEQSLPYGIPEMWISTFHAFCDRILRAEAVHIGLNPDYRLMSEAETIQFFRSHLFDFNLSYFRPLGNPTKFIQGMLTHFSRLKDEDVDPPQYMKWVKSQVPKSKSQNNNNAQHDEYEKYLELSKAFRMYEEMKVKEGLADYADLITNTLRLFRERKNVLSRYHEQFKYILIDEFQDTNYAQNELTVLLAGKRKNISVVGDDDQSVYKWRGAAISNILQFRKTYPKAKVVVLTKNYRSTSEILNRSYDLIQKNNPDRLEVAEKIDKKLESMRRVIGEPIGLIYEDRVENEADTVASEIQNLGISYEWKDFAILVRANNHSDPFIRALTRSGIPYQFLGPGQLYRQAEVKDLISYLKLLYDPADSLAAFRVLSMDHFGINPRYISTVVSLARKRGISVFEAAEFLVLDGEEQLKSIVDMVHRHLGLIKKESAGQILYYFLEDSGLLAQFVTYKTEIEERRAGNIAKLFDKLKSYEATHEDASVFAVVDWIDLSMSLGESPLAQDVDWTANNAVNILTVHSAKGLEFPVVFLVNCVSARFPSSSRKDQIPVPEGIIKEILPVGDAHIQEERRLFYVGMTRARDRLFLTGAKYYGDGKREKKLSLFISDALGDHFITQNAQPKAHNQQLFLGDWVKKEPNVKTMPVRQKVTYLSYSQMESFAICPLQYKYRNILKIPVPARAALSFGSAVHSALEQFYKAVKTGVKPTKKLLLESFHEKFRTATLGNKKYEEKLMRQGEELLTGFWEKGFDPDVIPVDLERAFKLKITPDLTFGGKIDRVDELSSGKIEIIDYKTGNPSASKDAKTDRQLSVYALAAADRGLYGIDPESVIVSFYYFDTQEKVSSMRTKEDIEATKSYIKDIAEKISTSDFSPTPGRHCDFCDFRLICEAWS